MKIQWKRIKPIEDSTSIESFENQFCYVFPDEFKELVKTCNGAFPVPSVFDSEKAIGRDLRILLSFNKSDIENIWDTYENLVELDGDYIAFAADDFGNLICFEKETNKVVFWDHELGKAENVAASFNDFLDKLYVWEEK